ncbi:MAG: 1-phosphofructokinase, partial [Candidatus Dormibacteraeota bacterium]|nr:1-phosphofructokinase [Candidatus Dormibacteraeota bacterium]
AAALCSAGAEVGVVTLGPDGLVALTPDGPWTVAPPEGVEGNPTGAGDAVTAMLATGLLRGAPWPDLLQDAVALGAAAARTPVAGEIDLDFFRRHRGSVHARRP